MLNSNEKNTNFKKLVNPDNFLLNMNNNQFSSRKFSFKKYIQLFDCYGETFLKNIVRFNKIV